MFCPYQSLFLSRISSFGLFPVRSWQCLSSFKRGEAKSVLENAMRRSLREEDETALPFQRKSPVPISRACQFWQAGVPRPTQNQGSRWPRRGLAPLFSGVTASNYHAHAPGAKNSHEMFPILQKEDIVDPDLALLTQITDHIPMESRFIKAARFGIAIA